MLQKILKFYRQKTIPLFVDNAAYDKSRLVKKWLKKHKNIRLHFLPAYSPNLNLIERLWGFFKKTILYNKSIEKFSDFQESCRSFFRYQKKYAENLRTLVTDNFHLFKKNDFQKG
ncbi:MAG: transposase [Planctomycetaceae bacterium]|nr:transposase [Planctomycetaceae bacterium]